MLALRALALFLVRAVVGEYFQLGKIAVAGSGSERRCAEGAARGSRRHAGLPVTLMSANVNAGPEQRARDAGAAELLRKPLSLQEPAERMACIVLGKSVPNP